MLFTLPEAGRLLLQRRPARSSNQSPLSVANAFQPKRTKMSSSKRGKDICTQVEQKRILAVHPQVNERSEQTVGTYNGNKPHTARSSRRLRHSHHLVLVVQSALRAARLQGIETAQLPPKPQPKLTNRRAS